MDLKLPLEAPMTMLAPDVFTAAACVWVFKYVARLWRPRRSRIGVASLVLGAIPMAPSTLVWRDSNADRDMRAMGVLIIGLSSSLER
jgi:hypothetical protein